MPEITLSDATLARLKAYAEPLTDTADDAVRRVLDIAENAELKTGSITVPRPGRDLVAIGGRIPHGTRLRAKYKGKEYQARVQDGQFIWDGDGYSSPTEAAIAVIQSTGSKRNTENGWRFWSEYFDRDEQRWVPTRELRRKSA